MPGPVVWRGVLAFGFANPWLLWGLALGVIPILVHLLHRRVHRETDWAAMRFLLEAARKNSRRLRVEQLVLLAVRTLILLLIAVAFAEPIAQALTSSARARAPVHRLVVIDSSFSMGLDLNGETRFAKAKKLARDVVAGCITGDAVNLLTIADRSGRVVVREPAFEPDPVLAVIDRLELTDEPGNLRPAVTEALTLLADPRSPAKKEVIFISDLQRSTWGGDAAGHADLPELFRRLADVAQIVLLDVGDPKPDNAAVISLQAVDPILLSGRKAHLRAGLHNFGRGNLADQRVELYVDGYLAGFKSAELPAGAETAVEFEYEFAAAGEHVIEARLPADRLSADNQRWLSVPVSERVNVLIVNGRQGGRPADNASHYVRAVLSPGRAAGDSASGPMRVKVLSEADLSGEDLSQYDCVFLCDVALVTPTEAALLQSYAEGGGGVVIAVGNRVRAANYNALLYRGGQGLLPAALGNRVGDPRDVAHGGFKFDGRDLNHPILAPFRGNPQAGLDRPITLEYLQATLPKSANGRVALRFSSGDPAIIEQRVGRGYCLLLTTSVDVSWSTWAVHPTFPPMIYELVRFAAQGRFHERQRLVGEPLVRMLSTRDTAVGVTVKSPDGSEQVVRPVQTENRLDVVFDETAHRGIYEMVMGPPSPAGDRRPSGSGNARTSGSALKSEGAAGARRSEFYAVNLDPRESDLQPVDDALLRSTTFAGTPFSHRAEWTETARDGADRETQRSVLASWLLAALLGLLLVEPLMAANFQAGLVLLCTGALVGVALVTIPSLWAGALVAGILLAGGVIAALIVGRRLLVSANVTGAARPGDSTVSKRRFAPLAALKLSRRTPKASSRSDR